MTGGAAQLDCIGMPTIALCEGDTDFFFHFFFQLIFFSKNNAAKWAISKEMCSGYQVSRQVSVQELMEKAYDTSNI